MISFIFVFVNLFSFFVEINCETCHSGIPYDRCSTNAACGCFPTSDAENVSICAFLWKFCSHLVPCQSSQDCLEPNHICVHHRRCNDHPVCYPLSMTEKIICPPMKNEIEFNQWMQNGTTVAGGNGSGDDLDQFLLPKGIVVDENKNILIADSYNHRIVKWKFNETEGIIVAGGNGRGKQIDELDVPTSVIVDKENNALIIADYGNRRVVRWFNENKQEILIPDIDCYGLALDKYGFIYISDSSKDEVRRWKMGEIKGHEGMLVAGGNDRGSALDQLFQPSFIFVDNEQSIYISDDNRIMKWRKNATEGVVVAGGNGRGNHLNQFDYPNGLIVDNYGQIYVADFNNHRIMRWKEGKQEGEIIVGKNGWGDEPDQLNAPSGLSFDADGNLYVADERNNRIQKFPLIS